MGTSTDVKADPISNRTNEGMLRAHKWAVMNMPELLKKRPLVEDGKKHPFASSRAQINGRLDYLHRSNKEQTALRGHDHATRGGLHDVTKKVRFVIDPSKTALPTPIIGDEKVGD